jgi:hypothetical protein
MCMTGVRYANNLRMASKRIDVSRASRLFPGLVVHSDLFFVLACTSTQ